MDSGQWSDSISPFHPGTFDWLFPAALRDARLKRRLHAELNTLVARNVENLRWATLQNLDATFRRFSRWFAERLAETTEASGGAIEAAAKQRRERAGDVESELARLRNTASKLAAIRDELSQAVGRLPPSP